MFAGEIYHDWTGPHGTVQDGTGRDSWLNKTGPHGTGRCVKNVSTDQTARYYNQFVCYHDGMGRCSICPSTGRDDMFFFDRRGTVHIMSHDGMGWYMFLVFATGRVDTKNFKTGRDGTFCFFWTGLDGILVFLCGTRSYIRRRFWRRDGTVRIIFHYVQRRARNPRRHERKIKLLILSTYIRSFCMKCMDIKFCTDVRNVSIIAIRADIASIWVNNRYRLYARMYIRLFFVLFPPCPLLISAIFYQICGH